MKKILILIILFSNSLIGQEFIFDIHNSSIEQCIETEQELESEREEPTSNHISYSGNAQPIKYLREESLIPDLTVFYYFNKVDSTITKILYEWDVSNFEKRDNNQQSDEFQKALISKYVELKQFITEEYGKPEVKKNYSNISRIDSINTFVESSNWSPNDTTEIEMYATVSNYYEKKKSSTINPVHRIRLYVKKLTPKEEPPKLDDERLMILKEISNDFFASLKNSDFSKTKEILAESIKAQASDEVLSQISNSIRNISDFELTASGTQLGFDGSQYSILNYSRINKMNNDKVNNFKVMFNDKNKIVSVK